jgi:hypothetical protein
VSITRRAAECDTPNSGADLAHRQVRPPVRRHQQNAIGQVEAPLPAGTAVGDLITTPPRHHPHQLAELARLQAHGGDNPFRPRRRDHLHHTMINCCHN